MGRSRGRTPESKVTPLQGDFPAGVDSLARGGGACALCFTSVRWAPGPMDALGFAAETFHCCGLRAASKPVKIRPLQHRELFKESLLSL